MALSCMMKIIAFIPSRYESTRFPGKPLAPIAGKPMIQHVYEKAKACPEISDVFVATDDERIAQCVRGFGGLTVMTSRDHFSGTDRIAEAASLKDLEDEDLVINIQGDQPTFDPLCLPYLIRPLVKDASLPMSTLVFKITDDREVQDIKNVKTVWDKEGFALFFSRAPIPHYRDSGSEKIYYKHLGFYAYRRKFLKTFASLPLGEWESAEKLEQLRALEYGYKIKIVESPSDSYEVDTPSDIEVAERILSQRTDLTR
jgi:3-deoxy-manno-octulosonate cytidylyltransferase (CMP-KDO synthetase)